MSCDVCRPRSRFCATNTQQQNSFSKVADFGSVTFSSQANFVGATFSRRANFVGATFSGPANFGKATLDEKTSLLALVE